MRAKFELQNVTSRPRIGSGDAPGEILTFSAVTEKPFDEDGSSDDNSFARWTPSGQLTMEVTNPELIGKFQPGQKFYLDFSPAV